MTQLSTTPLLPFTYSTAESQGQNHTPGFHEDEIFENAYAIIAFLIVILIPIVCVFGLVGNGIVIWYLCFLIKKNPITTYILNLAGADSGVLLALGVIYIDFFFSLTDDISWSLHSIFFTYITSQYLLTFISIEKCLLVFFPIWYRCHRPKYLSALICALLWSMTFLMNGMLYLLDEENFDLALQIISIVNFILCTPVLIICTVLLLISTCCSLHQQRRGSFYAVLLLMLLVFIFFGTPLSIILIFAFFQSSDNEYFFFLLVISLMCASINSSVNPIIYFLIGKKKRKRSRESFKQVFQRVFSDTTDCREGGQPVQIHLCESN